MFGLPGPDKLALELNRPVLDAERRLRAGCPDDQVYDLVLTVTGDPDAASAAYAERIAAVMKRGGTPDV